MSCIVIPIHSEWSNTPLASFIPALQLLVLQLLILQLALQFLGLRHLAHCLIEIVLVD